MAKSTTTNISIRTAKLKKSFRMLRKMPRLPIRSCRKGRSRITRQKQASVLSMPVSGASMRESFASSSSVMVICS